MADIAGGLAGPAVPMAGQTHGRLPIPTRS